MARTSRPERLSRRRLTAALMRRQLLDERRRLRPTEAVRRLVALQAQYSPAPYVALHARLDGFRPERLERALRRGSVVKSTLMRGTLHLVAADAYPGYAAAWGAEHARRLRGRHRRLAEREAELVSRLAEFTSLPRESREIRRLVRELVPEMPEGNDDLDYARALLPLVHVPPSGAWRYHGPYSLVRHRGPLPEPEVAVPGLVRDYLAAYGPASRRDIAAFTHLRMGTIDRGLEEVARQAGGLRRYLSPAGEELVDLPRAPLPPEDAELPVRFLAPFDQAVLAHRDKSRIVPDEHLTPVVRSTNGMVPGTFLLDGRVAGTWRSSQEGGVARMELAAPSGTGTRGGELEAEGRELLRFLHPGAESLVLSEVGVSARA